MERGFLALIVALGCGTTATPDAMDSSTGASVTSTSSSSTVGISSTSSSSGSSGEGEASGDTSDVKMDLPPPVTTSCDEVRGQVVELEIMTPDGPYEATHAWWGWSYCCIEAPLLRIADAPMVEIVDGEAVPATINVRLRQDEMHQPPWLGVQNIAVDRQGAQSELPMGLELLEVLDPEAPTNAPLPWYRATFAAEGEGWSINGSVEAPYCAALDVPPCPCE